MEGPRQFPISAASECELFEGLPTTDVERIVSVARPVEFLPGDVVYLADDPTTQVFLLTRGCVKKSQFSESGQEVILRLVVPGEIISEPTLVAGGRHSSTVLAIQDSRALSWELAN